MSLLLGLDLGSSSVKAALLEAGSGRCLVRAASPEVELEIRSPHAGWAEQDPELWWEHVQRAVGLLYQRVHVPAGAVAAIGISYQMHGLVLLGKDDRPLRPAILWCDSRAQEEGERLAQALGPERCRERLLNLPGNFTASKLAWVKALEPRCFDRARTFLLPGDYLALRLTGEACTTASGLSEGTLWDFPAREPARFLLDHLGLDPGRVPPVVPTFGIQGQLTRKAAAALGLQAGIPVSYRAGDQPNNAWSLSVLEPGEVAATAGTSGVVYAVTDRAAADPSGRVNTFLHVNDTPERTRLGLLLCLNGCGILQAWMKRLLGLPGHPSLDALAAKAPAGSLGLRVYPFGNGAERMLGGLDPRASLRGIDFRIHGPAECCRAAQEGIAFALGHGIEAMAELGFRPTGLRAGMANLFRSPVFRQTLANITGVPLELMETDGALGAARGAGLGAGIHRTPQESFLGLRTLAFTEPARDLALDAAYQDWKRGLKEALSGGGAP